MAVKREDVASDDHLLADLRGLLPLRGELLQHTQLGVDLVAALLHEPLFLVGEHFLRWRRRAADLLKELTEWAMEETRTSNVSPFVHHSARLLVRQRVQLPRHRRISVSHILLHHRQLRQHLEIGVRRDNAKTAK